MWKPLLTGSFSEPQPAHPVLVLQCPAASSCSLLWREELETYAVSEERAWELAFQRLDALVPQQMPIKPSNG